MAARFEVIVLGIAQDGGVPHLGCKQVCCTEARKERRELYPACLGIHDREEGRLLLVEATPAIEDQVAVLQDMTGSERSPGRPVDGILLTHAHVGHYLGLAHLGREGAATFGLPVFVSPRMAGFLAGNGPWSQLATLEQIKIVEFVPGGGFEPWNGLRVEAVPVPHRDEYSDTMAFKFHGEAGCVLFVPDVDGWAGHPGLLERLLDDVTVAYVDATFYDETEFPGRDISKIPHPLMIDTMERLQGWVQENPGAVRFIHLNHTNPALRDPAVQTDIKRRGFRIAGRGERVEL